MRSQPATHHPVNHENKATTFRLKVTKGVLAEWWAVSAKACRRRSCAAAGLGLWSLGKRLRLESQASGEREDFGANCYQKVGS